MSYWQHWQQGKELNNGQYIVEKYLGGGGFGVTYQIKEQRNNQSFALKTLNEKQQDQSDFETQQIKFINEAVALASCYHPHIVRVYPQMFKEGKLWCMVMEHVEGEDLAAYVTKKGFLTESEAVSIIARVGDALSYIHQRGLLHRDIKPQNILLRKADLSPVVIDFGLAREFSQESKLHSMTNAITESFAPVEQYSRQGKFGAWTDVYALAATLYVLLTAELPIPSRFRQHAPLVPPQTINARVSDRVNAAIIKGMEFAPEARPRTVQEWLDLLLDNSSNISHKNHQSQTVLPTDTKLQNDVVIDNQEGLLDKLAEVSLQSHRKVDPTVIKSSKKSPQNADNYQESYYDPQGASIYYERGNNSYSYGSYQEAIDHYSVAIASNSQYDNAYYRRGNSYSKLREYKKAIQDYDWAIQINPTHAAAYRERGNAYYALKNYQQAIDSYDRTIKLEPDYTSAYQYRGHAYYQLQDYDLALSDYYEALKIHPQNAEIYYGIANSCCQLGDYEAAIENCQEAIALNPERTQIYQRKLIKVYSDWGDHFHQSQEYSRAIQNYKNAIQVNPSNAKKFQHKITKIYLEKGENYYQVKQYQKSIKQYREAIKLDRDNADIYRRKMLQCYDRLIEFKPTANFYYERGKIHYALSNNIAAYEDYDRLINLSNCDSDAYYSRGEALHLLGKIDEAIQDYSKAVELNSENLKAYYKRSAAYKKIGKYKEAEADYKRANNIHVPESKASMISKFFKRKIL